MSNTTHAAALLVETPVGTVTVDETQTQPYRPTKIDTYKVTDL